MKQESQDDTRANINTAESEDMNNVPSKNEPKIGDQGQPSTSLSDADLDEATRQAISQAQKELNTRARPEKIKEGAEASPPPASASMSKPPNPRKRGAPKNTSRAMGKPAAKKRKTDIDGDARRSATPSTRGGKGSNSKRKDSRSHSHSQTPHGSSPAPSASGDSHTDAAGSDAEGDDNLYCICRKPDNHTWMIACDAGCDDWYHGACVAVSERDQDLIDRYVCPLCTAADRGVTTWKPMCRRPGCRRPARLKKGAESKYCSHECGVTFMRDQVAAAAATMATTSPPPRRAARAQKHPAHFEDDTADATDLGPLGGALRPQELKALALAAPTAAAFRALGSPSLPTPPGSPTSPSTTTATAVPQLEHFTPAETARLSLISIKKSSLRARHALLKSRERLVVLAKERAARLGVKDQCGFDARLGWDDGEFAAWRAGPEGAAALAPGGTLGGGDGDAEGLCVRRRCERHKAWQKLALQDVRFEEVDVGDEMRAVDAEEGGIRARGRARARRGGAEGRGEGGEVVRVDDGGGGDVGGGSGVVGGVGGGGDVDADYERVDGGVVDGGAVVAGAQVEAA